MAETKNFTQVRGSVIRVTRLDACGNPDPGAAAVVVSKRVSSVAFEEVAEEGNSIRERNFGGELYAVDDAFADVVGYTVETTMAGVDPAMVELMTGQPVVTNAAGDIVGFDVTSGIDLSGFGFALEIWSKIAGGACTADGQRLWGYTVAPFIQGGRMGGFTFEDGVVTFTISGAQTKIGNGWGTGPFDVDRGAGPGFAPSPLHTPLGYNTHYRNIMVSLDPPVAAAGAFPLASI